MSGWREVRVFVSSTFRDMQAERDHLIWFVIPRLPEELFSRRIRFVDIDLRWGVTRDQDALELCLKEIERCHPRFLAILGGCYGWILPPNSLPEEFDPSLQSGDSYAGNLSADERAALEQCYTRSACRIIPVRSRESFGFLVKPIHALRRLPARAISPYQRALAETQSLADQDPSNPVWHHALAVIHDRLIQTFDRFRDIDQLESHLEPCYHALLEMRRGGIESDDYFARLLASLENQLNFPGTR